MKSLFENKTIMITGGTGSIGTEMIRKLLRFNPKALRIFDIDETKQFEMQHELKDYDNIRYLLGDIRDKDRILRAMENVDIVFHMAALKHVYSCEYNPFEAVKTNVLGTQNVIDSALANNVDKVIFTSSDKAVNSCNVMGSTKMLCERLVTAANFSRGAKRTKFTTVRFGNVLGTRGSVLPLFIEQARKGQPLTVTDINMTRFVMSMSESLNLLLKTTQIAQGGEIFILKMPVIRPIDLANHIIKEYGSGNSDLPEHSRIKIIGNKAGEKMFEELMTLDESKRSFEAQDMFIVLPEQQELRGMINTQLYIGVKPGEHKQYSSDLVKPVPESEIGNLLKTEKYD
ncbi:MAG: NAD-dependent epimerase/dehydratase family protein [Nanohaloarchaea archaeon]|nr:NAD-dependent epimerase/dehydratase family protein [Candidatus Nanohaloarchaea archaeon]